MTQDVAQSEIELEFGVQFEEGEVEVAAESDLHEGLQGLGAEHLAFSAGHVVHGGETSHEIGAIIIEARCCHFEIEGQGYKGALEILRESRTVYLIAEGDVLRSKMQSRTHSQRNLSSDAPVAEHTYGEPKVLAVIFCHPLCSRRRIYETIVDELEALIVKSDVESIVPGALVDEGLVLHHTLLRHHR